MHIALKHLGDLCTNLHQRVQLEVPTSPLLIALHRTNSPNLGHPHYKQLADYYLHEYLSPTKLHCQDTTAP